MASGVEAVEGTDRARVWVEIDLTVSLAQYEPIKLSLGTSMECRNTHKTTARVRKQLAEDIESEIAGALERYTELARERANPKRKKGKR